MSTALRERFRLVWPSGDGWRALIADAPDPAALPCLAHWQTIDAPLVVTRQPSGLGADEIAVGLPAPAIFGRRRWAMRLPQDGIDRRGRFPAGRGMVGQLPVAARAAFGDLLHALDALGVDVRVHGSYGWQSLTAERYVHLASDLDLLLHVGTPFDADASAAVLEAASFEHPRLDGELLFDDGAGVAWREWRRARSGQGAAVLVKRIDGVAVEPVRAVGSAGRDA